MLRKVDASDALPKSEVRVDSPDDASPEDAKPTVMVRRTLAAVRHETRTLVANKAIKIHKVSNCI